jgi:hypothetical protein
MKNNIQKLRIIALMLFLVPSLALVGSLLLNNYLVSFKFTHEDNYNFKENVPGNTVKFHCSEENDFCDSIKFEKHNILGQCNLYYITYNFVTEDGSVKKINSSGDIKLSSKKIYIQFELKKQLNDNCITNSRSKTLYNLFPNFYESVYKIKNNKKTRLGTSTSVNPFIYGETSISNIVKRFPINLFFKPLLYLSVIIMLFYWIRYNKILKELDNSTKNYYFFSFGILSAIFLFLHVLFLGWTFESDFLTKLRRSYVVFFILFEVLAQAFLIKKIFSIKEKISKYLNLIIVYSKLLFVIFICMTTIIFLVILIKYDLDSKFDYILEWNYFLVLLFFYFLSFLMWKKLN